MSLPRHFCWTKFSTEAGEEATDILRRKEEERIENDGVFLWGIGNSIRPSLLALLERTPHPTVVFTPMRSPAAQHDRRPASILQWVEGWGLNGEPYELPPGSRVTSGARQGVTPRSHYALVCKRSDSLTDQVSNVWFDDEELRNLRTGSPVGSSQVTSVVEMVKAGAGRARYQVAFTAELVEPFQVVLTECIPAGRSPIELAHAPG